MGILNGIPILSTIVDMFPSMDYEGQKLAEKVYQWVIILFAVVGFVWGFICQQFAQTIYIFGAGIVLACVLVIPPWSCFRRHPLSWLKVASTDQKTSSGSSSSGSAGGSGSRKKDKNKTS